MAESKQQAPDDKRGGSRHKLTWQDKLDLLDKDVIKDFISTATCGCKHHCMQKIAQLQDQGIAMIHELRGARTAGMFCLAQQTTARDA